MEAPPATEPPHPHPRAAAPPAGPDDARDPEHRLGLLLDQRSAVRDVPGAPSAVTAVSGLVEGHAVVAYCMDARVMGGSLGSQEADTICAAITMALHRDVPVIGIWHSGGAKLADGVESMDGVGRMFAAMTAASGRIPQISVILGPAAGAAAYGPALTDVVIMSRGGRAFVTGPDVVRSVTGEQVDMATLGGPETHSKDSGVAHVVAGSDEDALRHTRTIAGLLASSVRELPRAPVARDPGTLVPTSARQVYDALPVVEAVLDGPVEQLHEKWAPNVIVALGRIGGRTIGVVANNPLRMGGCLDSAAAEKAARFVRMCDGQGILLLCLVDVPGYLPGVQHERSGVVRRGAKLLHAFAEASVPRITVILRKAYGGAYIAMNSRALGATHVFAWTNAEVAVMGAEAAVEVLHRKRIAATPDQQIANLREALVHEQRKATTLDRAVSLGVVDAVIKPVDTRIRVIDALAGLPRTRGRHGNIPL
ncbi:acyl-CoA carboxylase subunit beta [Pseudonocardia sp. DSM 110487]|nr:carboxyl transferase domain-containing protein [Pseudonocardia sp. DSM 110487]QYN33624.1 acyl-CoA carboxylase subunit beta [Pseudonocardia sp. DSM 110487]